MFSLFVFAECTCRFGSRSVGYSIFHIIGNSLVEQVAGYVAIFVAELLASFTKCCRVLYCSEAGLGVEPVNALYYSIGDNGNSRVTNHTVGLVAPKMPHWKVALLFIDINHRRNEFAGSLRLYNCHKGLFGAVRIP